MTGFVRFQSAAPNRHGRHPGVFALANGLRDDGRLPHDDVAWLQDANARATAAYVDPTSVVPGCYDPVQHPGARAWFRASALPLLLMCEPYLALLDRHDVAWMEVRTTSPGRITYEDDVQVVAVPHAYPDDWPFAAHPGR